MDESGDGSRATLPSVLVESLAPFSHLVCSRDGLFAVNHHEWVRVADGKYFGATVIGHQAIVFENSDRTPVGGRLLTLDLRRLGEFEELASGLDPQCHQLDQVRGRITIIDTENQRLLAVDDSGEVSIVARPLPATERKYAAGYVHFNSLLESDGIVYVMAHNGGSATGVPSRVLALDAEWKIVDQFLIPGFGCHNIVVLEDGTFMFCDSVRGSLISRTGRLAQVDDLFLRGLSVSHDEIVVGASQYAERPSRRTVPGRIHFLDRSFRSRAVLHLPGAPTEVRRLGGVDLGMSNYGAR